MAPHHEVKHFPRQAPGRDHLDIPDLRVLPTESLLLHEHPDEKRVARLEKRLQSEGFLKNPPIVAPIPGTGQFVVLDGANRTTAVKRIGCPHVLAQVVSYKSERVHLHTWYHLVVGLTPDAFLDGIKHVDNLVVQPTSLDAARLKLAERAIIAYIAVPPHDGKNDTVVYTIRERDGHGFRNGKALESATIHLNELVNTYRDHPEASIHRVSTDELGELLPYYDDVSGLVVFPPYHPDDITELAVAGTYVPTGITRHIITHRALRVNAPMDLLCSDASIEEKNAWWLEQLKRKLASNEIRLYQESTYLFDE